jgi:hypothetical protein
MPEPQTDSRRTSLLKLKMDMVYRGITTAKAEDRFNQNVLPPPPETQSAVTTAAPPPIPNK